MKASLTEICKNHVNNPVFDKPIVDRDYEKTGTVKLITKIRSYEIYRPPFK